MKTLTQLCSVGLLMGTMALSSCVSPYAGPNENVGAVAGGATGAVAGGIIGNQRGRGLEGAAIGGVIGSLAGGSLGRAQDQANYNYYYGY